MSFSPTCIDKKITDLNEQHQKVTTDLANLQRVAIQIEGALIILNQLKQEETTNEATAVESHDADKAE